MEDRQIQISDWGVLGIDHSLLRGQGMPIDGEGDGEKEKEKQEEEKKKLAKDIDIENPTKGELMETIVCLISLSLSHTHTLSIPLLSN